MADQCPATTRFIAPLSQEAHGVQCKFTWGHDGDHCAYAGPGIGDMFWAPAADGPFSDEDRIRDAMAEAYQDPGHVITR